MFALTGTHRSGKTTLAKILAEKLDIPFVDMRVSDVFAELGYSPKAHLSFPERLKVQGKILDHMEIKLGLAATSAPNHAFIADRSPYDVLGYTMADIQRDSMDADARMEATRQIQQAKRIVQSYVLGIIQVPALVNPPESPTSAQACSFYMNHVGICIQAAMYSYATPHLMAMYVESAELDERVAEAMAVLKPIIDRINRSVIWTPGQK